MTSKLLNSVEFPPIVAFKEKARKISPKSGRTFDVTQAVPSYPSFLRIREQLAQAVMAEETGFYTEVPGLKPLREAIARQHPLSGSLTAESILVTAGANHAMFTALPLYFQPGDRIALLEPYYFNYDMGFKMLGMIPEYLTLNNQFQLDSAQLIAQLEKSDVRGLILITPNNPTGAAYPAGEIEKLLSWTSERNIEVILDETYLRFDQNHLNLPSLGRFLGKGLSLVGSFSKSHSLTGYRIGYLAAGTAEISQALKIQDTSIICAPHISQLAALYGLNLCETEVQEQSDRVTALNSRLAARSKDLRHFEIVCHGAFFAYLRHPFPKLSCEEATLKLYSSTGILGLPGTIFGTRQQNFIRLAFCNLSMDDLDRAMDQLSAFERELLS